MMPATTALIIMKLRDYELERAHAHRGDLRRRQRRFEHHARLRKLFA